MAFTSPTTFLDRQIDTYGMPGQPTQQQRKTQPVGQPQAAVMPNGQPTPPQQPTQQTGAPTAQPQQYAQQAPANAGSVNNEGVYTAGQAPTQTYAPQAVQQFQAPQYDWMQNQQAGNIQQMLQSGGSLNPQIVAQMKGANTQQATLLERQMQGQLGAALGARGINPGGPGMAQMLQRQLMSDTNRNILNSNRGIDIQAAQQNWQDQMQANELANQFQNSALQRAIGGYQTGMQGLQFNSDEQLRGLDSIYKQFGAQQGMLGQQSSSLLNAIQNRNQSASINNQASQFDRSFGLDQSKFDWSKTMDERQLANQASAASAANSHWEDQMAFQYQKENEDNWMSMLSYLMGGQ